jgi:hypothetical protein
VLQSPACWQNVQCAGHVSLGTECVTPTTTIFNRQHTSFIPFCLAIFLAVRQQQLKFGLNMSSSFRLFGDLWLEAPQKFLNNEELSKLHRYLPLIQELDGNWKHRKSISQCSR